MTFLEALRNVDFRNLISRLNGYAVRELDGLDPKKMQGLEPADIVAEALRKAIDGTRTWVPDVPIEAFLWETVRSEISNFIKKHKKVRVEQGVDRDQPVLMIPMILEEKVAVINHLKAEGADDNEIYVFECWLEGIFKPSKVAGELEMDARNVYDIGDRLYRRLKKIQQQ